MHNLSVSSKLIIVLRPCSAGSTSVNALSTLSQGAAFSTTSHQHSQLSATQYFNLAYGADQSGGVRHTVSVAAQPGYNSTFGISSRGGG